MRDAIDQSYLHPKDERDPDIKFRIDYSRPGFHEQGADWYASLDEAKEALNKFLKEDKKDWDVGLHCFFIVAGAILKDLEEEFFDPIDTVYQHMETIE